MNEFRVWCNDNKEWEKDLCVLTPDGRLLTDLKGKFIPLRKENHIVIFSTGLNDITRTDKYPKGKTIYNHSIVKIQRFARYNSNLEKVLKTSICEVIFENGQYLFHDTYKDDFKYRYDDIESIFLKEECVVKNIEVIGHKFENTEILDESKMAILLGL